MKSRDEIFNLYIQQYSSDLSVKKTINPFFIPSENDINESIENEENKIKNYLPEIVLSEDEKKIVKNKIKSIFSIYQEEGHSIIGENYEHDYNWYNKLLNDGLDEYYWSRYKYYLADKKHFSANIIDTLENKTLKTIMSYLGNPKEDAKFSIRGLVVGDVQSGKTSNYLGLLTKAADAGYKVIFVLTGTIESLRKQTQERVEEGFIGYDSSNGVDVGVGRGEKTPKAFTSRDKDFRANDDKNTTYRISDYSAEPMIYVVKKNVTVLKRIYTSLKKINTTLQYDKINFPMLMIDDEADNASINTNKLDNDPTKINEYIRKILSLFSKSSYVGFTATPFANVFISYDSNDEMLKDDLFPRDFIYSLNAPSNYCGSRKYFFEENENVRTISDYDDNLFPMKHKKDWYGNKLFDSVYHAINTFLIANTVRDIRDKYININTHRSMLINMTRYTQVQIVIKAIVEEYYRDIKTAIKQCHKLSDKEYALTNPLVQSIKSSFEKEYKNIIINGSYLTWDEVFKNLYESIKDIKIVTVNSSKQSAKLNYDDYKTTGLRVIAIGGLALSRGLTLEGLCVSYFYRNTATFDVLMQMGRWFGYRDGYEDLCKIFITKESAYYYKNICKSIEDLRKDIEEMETRNQKPEDYGIRVRNYCDELNITASNKMRNTTQRVDRKSFYGNVFETPYLDRDLNIIENNIKETFILLKNIDISSKDNNVKHPYFRNISKKYIIDFLSKIVIHKANINFDVKQLLKFINKGDNELNYFDILVIGGEKNNLRKPDFIYNELSINNYYIHRCFDIQNGIIRMSRARAHLMGRQDTKNGLNKENIIAIGENARSQDYMINNHEFRNPLLIIYIIDPDNSNLDEDENNSSKSHKDDKKEELALKIELNERTYKYLIGYAIGFPYKENATEENVLYTVNKTVDYFDKDHEYDNDFGDDANE